MAKQPCDGSGRGGVLDRRDVLDLVHGRRSSGGEVFTLTPFQSVPVLITLNGAGAPSTLPLIGYRRLSTVSAS